MADLRSIKAMVANEGYRAKEVTAPAVAQLPVSETVNISSVGQKRSLASMVITFFSFWFTFSTSVQIVQIVNSFLPKPFLSQPYDFGVNGSSMMEDVNPEDAMAKIMDGKFVHICEKLHR